MSEVNDASAPSYSTSVTGNEIKDNDINGDLNIASVVIKNAQIDPQITATALRGLIAQHEKLKEDCPMYLMTIEQLQSKISDNPSRTVIGLEKKLTKANREDFIRYGLKSSQLGSRTITQYQHLRAYQVVFNHILSKIITRFNAHVQPLLDSKESDLVIKNQINNMIVEPLHTEVLLAGSMFTTEMVEAMLYFLTEKCHVEWS